MDKVRFIAMHESEPGYPTVEDVNRWIAAQDNPNEWRIVQISVDALTEGIIEKSLLELRDQFVQQGISQERQRIVQRLSELLKL